MWRTPARAGSAETARRPIAPALGCSAKRNAGSTDARRSLDTLLDFWARWSRAGHRSESAACGTQTVRGERHRPRTCAPWAMPERAADPVPARLSRVLGRLGRGAAGLRRRASTRWRPTSAAMRAPPSPRASRPTASSIWCATSWRSASTSRPAGRSRWSAHDWGASVAYATAIAAPHRVARLVVINGVHPGPFQRALIEDEAQRRGQRLHALPARSRGRGAALRQQFEKLLGMLSRFGPQPWLTPRSGPAIWRPGRRRAR